MKKNIIDYTLFITTDNEEKASEISNLLNKYKMDNITTNIILTPNTGRDVYPWLCISDELSRYELIGHFHTKKSPHSHAFKGKSWTDELIACLMSDIKSIAGVFAENDKIGVIIPDIPTLFKLNSGYDGIINENRVLCNSLWEKMFADKIDFNFFDILTPIMSYGNMFWYRPKALRPLMSIKTDELNIPDEPLPNDGTVLHAIERLPVYVAWKQGYDYRVLLNKDRLLNGFDYAMFEFDRAEKLRLKALNSYGIVKRLRKKIMRRIRKIF